MRAFPASQDQQPLSYDGVRKFALSAVPHPCAALCGQAEGQVFQFPDFSRLHLEPGDYELRVQVHHQLLAPATGAPLQLATTQARHRSCTPSATHLSTPRHTRAL